MDSLMGLAAALFVTGSLVAAAHAAPDLASAKTKVPLGVKNARKAMEAKRQQDVKVGAVRKQGHELRRQSRGNKAASR